MFRYGRKMVTVAGATAGKAAFVPTKLTTTVIDGFATTAAETTKLNGGCKCAAVTTPFVQNTLRTDVFSDTCTADAKCGDIDVFTTVGLRVGRLTLTSRSTVQATAFARKSESEVYVRAAPGSE
jgi:hypothetical protein